jgi:D-alanyl-D-alanine carboxypeptidase
MKQMFWVLAIVFVLLIVFQLSPTGMGSQDAVDGYLQTQSIQTSKLPFRSKAEIQEARRIAQQANGKMLLTFPILFKDTTVFISSLVGSQEAGVHDKGHAGTDISYHQASVGEKNLEIVSATDGIIKSVERSDGGGYGAHVVIEDSTFGLRFTYGHLVVDSQPRELVVGAKVKAGDKLGIMGKTGHSTGVHLHFEIAKNGAPFALDVPGFKGMYLSALDQKLFVWKKGTTPTADKIGWDAQEASELPLLEESDAQPASNSNSVAQGGTGGTDPNAILVLANKTSGLPAGYVPPDLTVPNVAFTFTDKSEKRMLRKEAATALEKMFILAGTDKIYLAGVSGYRSEARQKEIYDAYVKSDGQANADRYSSKPGFSEHQTGLAMDVSGTNGKCQAEDCFAGSPEADWIAVHAHEYGFIVHYLKGKESVTGYQYEPWHIRYVGVKVATEIHSKGITLEEYLS